MKKIFLLAVMAFFAQCAMAQSTGGQQSEEKEKTLYLVDGKIFSKEESLKIPSDSIESVNVIKGIENVVMINTKSGGSLSSLKGSVSAVSAPKNKIVVKGDASESDPLVIVKDNKGEMSVSKNIREIKSEDIKSIYVFKDSQVEEFKKYGDTSKGVVLVELK